MTSDDRSSVDQVVWVLAVIGGLTLFVLVASWLVDHGIR